MTTLWQMASGAGLKETSRHTEASSPYTFVTLGDIFYLLSFLLKLCLECLGVGSAQGACGHSYLEARQVREAEQTHPI